MDKEYLLNIIKESINEINNSGSVDIKLAQQLLHDPNNEVVCRCFHSKDEDKIFEYGYSSEFFGSKEGSMYGDGIYFFRKAQGASWRVDTGGVGDKIMKCVIVNGFKDFLIFDKKLAIKYYGSDDITVQLRYFFGNDSLSRMMNLINKKCGLHAMHRHIKDVSLISSIMGNYTAPVASLFSNTHEEKFGSLQGIFREEIKKSKVRGLLYSGSNDVWAGIIFNPRDIIPISVTNEKSVPNEYSDFGNWKTRITDNLYNTINTVKDFYIYGEKLKVQGKIRNYSKMPPQNDCLFVTLMNGKSSAYNIKLDKFISNYGFDQCIGWETRTIMKNGEEFSFKMLPIIADRKKFLLRYNPKEENYVFYTENNVYKQYETLKNFDNDRKNENLNESLSNIGNYLTVYHRTDRGSADGIFAGGFSKEYTGRNANIAGPGIYFTFSSEESTRLTSGFGPVMLRCKLENGLKNYIIPPGVTVLGNRCTKPLIEQVVDLTYPAYKNEIYEKYKNFYTTESIYITLCRSGELGKTRIRGLIYHYGGGIAAVAADWGSIIAYEYSNDNGKTWHNGTDEEKLNFIKSHGDAKFALNKFIANGIIKDTFGNYENSLSANQQFNNGYLRVILKKNGKISFYDNKIDDIISYEGFDEAVSPEVINENGNKIIVIPVVINGEKYQIRKIDNEYWLFKQARSYQIFKLSDGTPFNTDMYDYMMNNK